MRFAPSAVCTGAGSGTEDTPFIRAMATRNKRALARINIGYREAYGETLQALIRRELLTEGNERANEWYAYLATFLVVQEEQAVSTQRLKPSRP